MPVDCCPLHLVQVGLDDSAFSIGRDSEFVRRQVDYGELLEQLRPHSVMTLVVLTANRRANSFRIGNVTFKPLVLECGWLKFRSWYSLYLTLEQLNRDRHIAVLTPPTFYDDAWIALLFAKNKRLAIIGQIHFDIFNPHAKAMLFHSWLGRVRYTALIMALKYFTALRVVGEGIAREITKRDLHKHVDVIPVPMSMLDGEIPFESKRRESKVLFVGRLVEEKNLTAWLEVAKLVAQNVPEANFEIVGEGKLREELEYLAEQMGLGHKVCFSGFVDYEKLAEIYQSASVFLITSLYEGFGRVVAEALANRVPVVAPRITGIEDIVVHSQSGFLHSAFDVSGMAESVITLLRSPSMVDKMGRWGEKFVKEKFDPAILTRKWVQLLVDYAC